MARGRIFRSTDRRDVVIGNSTHLSIVPCCLWKCCYHKVLGKEKGECMVPALRIKPNKKKCRQRDTVMTKAVIRKQKALWNGKKVVN